MGEWHKSSFSNDGGHCAETREGAHGTDMRDTQNRDKGTLSFDRGEWSALLSTVVATQ